MIRIGCGWDSHRLVAGCPLILGGVQIAHSHGLAGHSDADVLLHAIIDALFGAAGLPDIGQHFPDTDAAYRNISSMDLLQRAVQELHALGWQVHNIDSTLIAEQPKLAPHILSMRQNIAAALALPYSLVNVKAKTAEGLDSVGRGESIVAQAVVLITSQDVVKTQ